MGITFVWIVTAGVIVKQSGLRIFPICVSLVIGLLQSQVNRFAPLLGGENGENLGLDGATFCNGGLLDFAANCYLLEEDRSDSYCYPALQETRDDFLVAYYHSNGGEVCLNSTKIIKVYLDELKG